MGKVFEDLFMDLQADMVSICSEYVDYQADKIYLYCCREGRLVHSDCFYDIDGQIVERWNIRKVAPRNTTTPENEEKVLDILLDDLCELEKLCIEHGRPMPTEIKMIYDVKRNSLDVKYKYDNQWLGHKIMTSDDILAEWFEEVKNSKQTLEN